MLSADETKHLLYSLCIKLGFCLPPEEQKRLVESPPKNIDEFTVAVFVAEGLDAETADRQLYRDVRDMVASAFRKSAGDAQQIVGPERR